MSRRLGYSSDRSSASPRRRLAQRQRDYPLHHGLGLRRLARRWLFSRQSRSTRSPMNRSCQRHTVAFAADLTYDGARAHAVGAQQHNPRPFHMLPVAIAVGHDRPEPSTIVGVNLDLDPFAHTAMIPDPPCRWDVDALACPQSDPSLRRC